MDFRLDQSLVALGIDTVVVGIARNVDPQAVLHPSFLEKKKELEQWAPPVSDRRSSGISCH